MEIFQDLGEEPEVQNPFKMSRKNFFETFGRWLIKKYGISSSPGEDEEDKDRAYSNSSRVNKRLYDSELVLLGGTITVEFLILLKARE